MQLNSEKDKTVLSKVKFMVGSVDIASRLPEVSATEAFSDNIIHFLNDVSRALRKDPRSKAFSDVATFSFWIRKGSVMKLKKRFNVSDDAIHLGKGVVFHIAPSNVPVNFAYSMVSGLLAGNANVVRVPSKDFPQVGIICDAFNRVLDEYENMKPFVVFVRYDKDRNINDLFSSIADMRVVWGGDQTIAELRKSELPARSGEITFADRYSLAVVDSDTYMNIEDKNKVAEDFYNDTFLFDQNACTSPRTIIWMGNRIDEAKKLFWMAQHKLAERRYTLQAIQAVNKLASSYLIASVENGVLVEEHSDNLIIRVKVPEITKALMEYQDNSGYFYEYDCQDIMDLMPIVNDSHCQTIAYIGEKDILLPLIKAGVKGIDRLVPIGKTMDFDLIWDGYNLPAMLTRNVVFV